MISSIINCSIILIFICLIVFLTENKSIIFIGAILILSIKLINIVYFQIIRFFTENAEQFIKMAKYSSKTKMVLHFMLIILSIIFVFKKSEEETIEY